MKRFVGTYDNGYPFCEERLYFIADNEKQVEMYMSDGLTDYADSYSYFIDTDEEDEEATESALDWYYDNCDWCVTEIEDDCEDYDDVDEVWIDLRREK